MGATNNNVFLFSVELTNIGVLARNKTAEMSDLIVTPIVGYTLPPRFSISTNEDGEYNITNDMLTRSTQGELYDDDCKILQWSHDEKGLFILESFTNK